MEGMPKLQRMKLDRLVKIANGDVELVRRALSSAPTAGDAEASAAPSRSIEDVEAYLRKALAKAA